MAAFQAQPPPPLDNVIDLQKDRLVMWQHRYIHWIGALVVFALPAGSGTRGAAAGGPRRFLIAGVARVVLPPTLHLLHQLALPLHRQTDPIRASAVRATRG